MGEGLLFLLTSSFPVALALLGVICIILAIMGSARPTEIKGGRAYLLGGLGIFLVLCAVGVTVFSTLASRPEPTRETPSITPEVPTPTDTLPTNTLTETPINMPTTTSILPIEVSITSHSDGAEVSHTIDISGPYQNIPEDRQIWLYVYATFIRKYYLQPIDRLNNGTWQVRGLIIGEPDETGTRFKIGLISVDERDHENLLMNFSALDELPPSSQNLHEITVYR